MSNIMQSPITGVWEITMGCNMRCKHCGSSCKDALLEELTTEEALKLCDDIKDLGFKWITLSGGEPTTRADWHLIAKRLNDNGVIPNIITNGWLMDEDLANRAKEAGVNTIAFSLDGLKETHNSIRKEGSYERIMNAIEICRTVGLNVSVITTLNKRNLPELEEMHTILSEKVIYGWQFQIGLPMGNMAQRTDLIATPEDINFIIDFAHNATNKGGIEIQLADCIGYFNEKEIHVRSVSTGSDAYDWQGCGAGKAVLGILHNGNIVGCTSIRSKEFIEGNIRNSSLKEIWENPESFAWNRKLKKTDLEGLCSKCIYGERCLGGCSNTRLTMEGHIHDENKFCSYNLSFKKAKDRINLSNNMNELINRAENFMNHNNLQLAELILQHALQIEPTNVTVLQHYGYVSFMLGNYQEAREANQILLNLDEQNPYHNKGLGLSLAKLGHVEEGISFLRRSIDLSDSTYAEPYHDLAVILFEQDRIDEAIAVLSEGRDRSRIIKEGTESLFQHLKNCIQSTDQRI